MDQLARKCAHWIGLRVDIWLYVVFPRLGKYNVDILAWALGENPVLTIYHLHHSIKMHYNALARWLDLSVQSPNARAVAELYDNFEMISAYITENDVSNLMVNFRGRVTNYRAFAILGGHTSGDGYMDPQIVGCSGAIELAKRIPYVQDQSDLLRCAILCGKMNLVRWCMVERPEWMESTSYVAACACANASMRVELIRMLHKAFPDVTPHPYAYAVAMRDQTVFDELCKIAPTPEDLHSPEMTPARALAALVCNLDIIDTIPASTLSTILTSAYGCDHRSFEAIRKKLSRGMGWTSKAICYAMATPAIIMGDLDTVKHLHAVDKLGSIALMNILAVRDSHPHLIEWALTEEWVD
jgi:hypothetical protein